MTKEKKEEKKKELTMKEMKGMMQDFWGEICTLNWRVEIMERELYEVAQKRRKAQRNFFRKA